MASILNIKKGKRYKCIMRMPVPSGYGTACHVDGIYESPEDGYIVSDLGVKFAPYRYTLGAYLKPIEE